MSAAASGYDLSSLDGIQAGYADFLRADYDDYRKRFRPFEGMLGAYFKPEQHAVYDRWAQEQAADGVNQAYNAARAYQQELGRRTGARLDAVEQGSVNRQLGNQRAALLSQAANTTSDRLEQRDKALLGTLANFGQQDRQNALGQFGYLSGLSNQRQQNNTAMNNAASQQQQSTIAGAAGTAITTTLATGNPYAGLAMGGVQLLGSLF